MTERSEPTVCVAFGLELGEEARRRGIVYDVDESLLERALLTGGLSQDDIITCPTVIKKGEDSFRSGTCHWKEPGHHDDPSELGTRIELYTEKGAGKISTKTATHEARHLADRIYEGEGVFVSERAKAIRKVAATVGAAAIVTAYFYNLLRGTTLSDVDMLEYGALGAAELDFVLSGLLVAEYGSRKQERRARRAANQVQDNNVLRGVTSEPNSRLARLKSTLKTIFIPNFGL